MPYNKIDEKGTKIDCRVGLKPPRNYEFGFFSHKISVHSLPLGTKRHENNLVNSLIRFVKKKSTISKKKVFILFFNNYVVYLFINDLIIIINEFFRRQI